MTVPQIQQPRPDHIHAAKLVVTMIAIERLTTTNYHRRGPGSAEYTTPICFKQMARRPPRTGQPDDCAKVRRPLNGNADGKMISSC
ncbi:MAG: hypothetical protein VX257_11320, partial [Planctomycetota bacterium]|nr:hypothetical protein [Planctomycetota bacterium]